MVIEVAALGIALKEIINSGAAEKATNLISSVKEGRDKDKTIAVYEEAFNKLIHENQELKAIALQYKDQVEQINLSEKDIDYLQKTATRLINMFMPEVNEESKGKLKEQLLIQGYDETEVNSRIENWAKEQENQRQSFEQFVDLIQVDTLRTMQLLGFNYKKAIGEPLTELTAQTITNSIKNDKNALS